MEQQANSNDDFSFTVLTQFADRAYNVEDNIISSEKNKLLSAIDYYLITLEFMDLVILNHLRLIPHDLQQPDKAENPPKCHSDN